MHNQQNITKLSMYTVRLGHKNKFPNVVFYVVPGDSPALLGMSDIKLLNLLKILYEVVKD